MWVTNAWYVAAWSHELEAGRILAIRDDDGDRGNQPAGRDRVDERLEVAAAPRNEDAESPVHVKLL